VNILGLAITSILKKYGYKISLDYKIRAGPFSSENEIPFSSTVHFPLKKIKIILDHFPPKNKIIKSLIVDRSHQNLNR
jgi:hypothetical protein